MKIGDIVELEGCSKPEDRYRLLQKDRWARTFKAIQWSSASIEELPDDLERQGKCRVICNPVEEWPFVVIKNRGSRVGPVVSVLRSSENRQLQPMSEWVPTDQLQLGGALFFNPELRLSRGEILIATHRNGSLTRVAITPAFGSLRLRKKRLLKANEPSTNPTAFDRIMQDDSFDEGEE